MSRMESFAAGLATCLLLAGAAAAQDLAEVPRERTLVTIGWSAGSPTLSAPNNANWYSLGAELRNGIMFVNEPLFTYNHFTGEHIPWIAESYEYNDDYTSLTVKLRDGVTWSDGEAFDAEDVAFTLNMLMMGINLAAYPALVQALERGDSRQVRDCRLQHFRLLFAVALPATVGLILVAPNLVELMIGAEFRPAVRRLLPVIAVAVLLSGLKAYYFDLAFQLGEHPRGQLQILVLAAGLNLMLNGVLIPRQGMQGAALATLITFGVALLLSAVRGRRHFPLVFPLADLGRMMLAVGVMVAVLVPLYDTRGAGWLLLQVLGGAAVYGVVLLLVSGRSWGWSGYPLSTLPFISR